eukprot:12890622-Prorocentrum_lima.AAC.1
MQELNKRMDNQKKQLVGSKRFSHKRVLSFAAKVFNMQRPAGRHARLEHPRFAMANKGLSWIAGPCFRSL